MALLFATAGMATGLLGLSMLEMEHDRRREKALRRMMEDPEAMRHMAMLQAVEDSILVRLLVVHVDSSELSSNLAGNTLRLKVKYGKGDHSLKEKSRNVKATTGAHGEAVSAPFQMTCVFPWVDDVAPVLKLSLQKIGGFMDSTLSEVKLNLPFSRRGRAGSMQEDVIFLQGKASDILGQVHIHAELHSVPRGALYGRMPFFIPETHGRREMPSGPVVQGMPAETQSNQHGHDLSPRRRGEVVQGEVVQGQVVSAVGDSSTELGTHVKVEGKTV